MNPEVPLIPNVVPLTDEEFSSAESTLNNTIHELVFASQFASDNQMESALNCLTTARGNIDSVTATLESKLQRTVSILCFLCCLLFTPGTLAYDPPQLTIAPASNGAVLVKLTATANALSTNFWSLQTSTNTTGPWIPIAHTWREWDTRFYLVPTTNAARYFRAISVPIASPIPAP